LQLNVVQNNSKCHTISKLYFASCLSAFSCASTNKNFIKLI